MSNNGQTVTEYIYIITYCITVYQSELDVQSKVVWIFFLFFFLFFFLNPNYSSTLIFFKVIYIDNSFNNSNIISSILVFSSELLQSFIRIFLLILIKISLILISSVFHIPTNGTIYPSHT